MEKEHKTLAVRNEIHEKIKNVADKKGKKLEREVEDMLIFALKKELKNLEVNSND